VGLLLCDFAAHIFMHLAPNSIWRFLLETKTPNLIESPHNFPRPSIVRPAMREGTNRNQGVKDLRSHSSLVIIPPYVFQGEG